MDKAYSRIDWENEPSINTPINATNLNRMDNALNVIDNRVISLDTTKAEQNDILQCFNSITYNSETGVFVFTKKNGSSVTVDLNVEKIPVSFSMDSSGVITMITSDGTQYTADIGSMIFDYDFIDSSTINFTVTEDSNGDKHITADIIQGSITDSMLESHFLSSCQEAKTAAEAAETATEQMASDSEAWAKGTRGGVPVPTTDETHENNAKFYAEQAASYVGALAITDEQWAQIEAII